MPPGASLTKTATPNSGVVGGDVINYTFDGTNNGTVTLHSVGVTDPMPGLSAVTCVPAAPATLGPNATISCTANYTVTQADIDAGSFTNTATIAGDDPSNNPTSTSASATVNAATNASIALTKTPSPAKNMVSGDTVTYTFGVTNTCSTIVLAGLAGSGSTDQRRT